MATRRISKKVSDPRFSKRVRTARASSAGLAEGEAMFEMVKSSSPKLTNKNIGEIERAQYAPTQHIWRRAALASLAQSGQEILEGIERDRETAKTAALVGIGIRGYLKQQREFLDFIETAAVRIEFLLCVREDMEAIRAEAAKELEVTP